MLTNLRNALMTGKWLPYDAEVEYLESTGTQWIDTGIVANDSIVLNCDFQLTNLTPINQLSGTYSTNGRLQFGIVDGKWSIGIGSVGVAASVANTARHNVIITVPQKQVLFDGANYGNYSSASLVYYSWQRLLLFARTNASYGIAIAEQECKEKIFRCTITDQGVLVRDFIPVRKGTVGYLYDRVSGKIFGNAGTGAFTYGNDLKYPIPAS